MHERIAGYRYFGENKGYSGKWRAWSVHGIYSELEFVAGKKNGKQMIWNKNNELIFE